MIRTPSDAIPSVLDVVIAILVAMIWTVIRRMDAGDERNTPAEILVLRMF
jgi:hypothetical protein